MYFDNQPEKKRKLTLKDYLQIGDTRVYSNPSQTVSELYLPTGYTTILGERIDGTIYLSGATALLQNPNGQIKIQGTKITFEASGVSNNGYFFENISSTNSMIFDVSSSNANSFLLAPDGDTTKACLHFGVASAGTEKHGYIINGTPGINYKTLYLGRNGVPVVLGGVYDSGSFLDSTYAGYASSVEGNLNLRGATGNLYIDGVLCVGQYRDSYMTSTYYDSIGGGGSNKVRVLSTTLTGNRTATLPDKSGTIAMTSDIQDLKYVHHPLKSDTTINILGNDPEVEIGVAFMYVNSTTNPVVTWHLLLYLGLGTTWNTGDNLYITLKRISDGASLELKTIGYSAGYTLDTINFFSFSSTIANIEGGVQITAQFVSVADPTRRMIFVPKELTLQRF